MTTATGSTPANSTPGMYYDFSIPLGLKTLIEELIVKQPSSPNSPILVSGSATNREWFSQPRPGTDTTTEVLTARFKVPLALSEVSLSILRVSCQVELWYQDVQGNWTAMLNTTRVPVVVTLSSSNSASWYPYHTVIYPVVAKAVQVRLTRLNDPLVGNAPYVTGVKDLLLRRNVYDRDDGKLPFEDNQDPLGNVISAYVEDWDASRAIDNAPTTYWRSAAQPDPAAVVSLYLDLRTPGGGAQLIDTVYLDPVYVNQTLNLYYSTDDTTGPLRLSPITLLPTLDENTAWKSGVGRYDLSNFGDTSDYWVPLTYGPLVSQDLWIGIEWAPDFYPVLTNAAQSIVFSAHPTSGHFFLSFEGDTTDILDYTVDGEAIEDALEALPSIGVGNVSVTGAPGGPFAVVFQNVLASQDLETLDSISELNPSITITTTTVTQGGQGGPPPENPILFKATPTAPDSSQYWPVVFYDGGAGQITLELTNGTTVHAYSVPLSPLPTINKPLRIAIGWAYGPDTVTLQVCAQNGTVLGSQSFTGITLPPNITLNGPVGFSNFRGTFTAHIVKLENAGAGGAAAFLANPTMYTFPAPVLPNPDGSIPSTSLDDAIFAVAWALQTYPTGGSHETVYENKLWTPIWRDYITAKGKLFFPQAVSAKYLKLEFTNLTESPYPVYDVGITTTYKKFPATLTANVSGVPTLLGAVRGLLSLGTGVLEGYGAGSVNWLNPSTVNKALSMTFSAVTPPTPVTVTAGPTAGTMPTASVAALSDSARTEAASPWVYRRSNLDPGRLAAQMIAVINNTSAIQSLGSRLDPVAVAVAAAFPVPGVPVTTWPALPVQGNDWWVFPGGTLKMAASVMTGITGATQVVTSRGTTTEVRIRWKTTQVHRYDTKTVTLDAAVAYFAGVREVQVLTTSYIADQDPVSFDFTSYDPTQWVLTNTRALDSGPISTAGKLYSVDNQDFDLGLGEWTPAMGSWAWDGSPFHGYMYPGSAMVTANGAQGMLVSPNIVAVGANTDVSPGEVIDLSVAVRWDSLIVANAEDGLQLAVIAYDTDGNVLSTTVVASVEYADWTTHTSSSSDLNNYVKITGSYTVPDGTVTAAAAFIVTSHASSGTAWFDILRFASHAAVEATVYKDFTTTGSFAKVTAHFYDSGSVRSDAMWAQADPLDTNIDATALAYYTSTIPDVLPAGTWGDSFATWADTNIAWGSPRALVAIDVDPNRVYQGVRVLHFYRAAGAEEAGVKVRQWTNMVPNALCRIGARWLKPADNGNTITLRLRRLFDGVYIYEQTFTDLDVGYWFTEFSNFFEIPESDDQVYTVELLLTGDDADELYLSDLWLEIDHVRYFMRLGGEEEFLHEVTPLKHTDTPIVSCTQPVTEMVVQASILSPKVWLYNVDLTPQYLQ